MKLDNALFSPYYHVVFMQALLQFCHWVAEYLEMRLAKVFCNIIWLLQSLFNYTHTCMDNLLQSLFIDGPCKYG